MSFSRDRGNNIVEVNPHSSAPLRVDHRRNQLKVTTAAGSTHELGYKLGNSKWSESEISRKYPSASVDVFCRKTDGHGWQNVVHMTQGTNRDQFGDRYFTIWQRADGKLKLNGPLKGNTQFDEVEYYVDCEDQTWTNIAISQTQRDGGLLELSMFQILNDLITHDLML